MEVSDYMTFRSQENYYYYYYYRLLQCFKTCKGLREFIIWRKKSERKESMGVEVKPSLYD